MIEVIKLLLYRSKLKCYLHDYSSVFFHVYNDLRDKTVVREKFILEKAKHKTILHFGFLDSPFTKEKILNNQILHLQLKKTSKYLYGVDIDKNALQTYRKITNDEQNSLMDVGHSWSKNMIQCLSKGFDLILFTEILEHLKNPGIALDNLLKISKANGNCEVLISVPNAFFVGSFLAAMDSNEIVHDEHYYYYSPHTLKRLLKDCGFSRVEIYLCSESQLATSPGITKRGLIALCQG